MLTICGPISAGGIWVQILHLPSDSRNNRPPSTQPPVLFIKFQLSWRWHGGRKTNGMAGTHRLRTRKQGWRERQQPNFVFIKKKNSSTWENIESLADQLLWKSSSGKEWHVDAAVTSSQAVKRHGGPVLWKWLGTKRQGIKARPNGGTWKESD